MKSKVLLLDDDEALLESFSELFEDSGFEVFSCNNGRAGFLEMIDQKPDVIVSDVRMKNGDGIELLSRVARIEDYSPVIAFMTGYLDISQEEFLNQGADFVFTKPVRFSEMVEKIREALVPAHESWPKRRVSNRTNLEMRIDLTIQAENVQEAGHLINLGRKGMFIAVTDKFPSVGSNVSFKFEFVDGKSKILFDGVGEVVWVRSYSLGEQPRGIGLKFLELNEDAMRYLFSLSKRTKKVAIIPSGLG